MDLYKMYPKACEQYKKMKSFGGEKFKIFTEDDFKAKLPSIGDPFDVWQKTGHSDIITAIIEPSARLVQTHKLQVKDIFSRCQISSKFSDESGLTPSGVCIGYRVINFPSAWNISKFQQDELKIKEVKAINDAWDFYCNAYAIRKFHTINGKLSSNLEAWEVLS
jgi:hypothetical protein